MREPTWGEIIDFQHVIEDIQDNGEAIAAETDYYLSEAGGTISDAAIYKDRIGNLVGRIKDDLEKIQYYYDKFGGI